jgi:hypothetical protein
MYASTLAAGETEVAVSLDPLALVVRGANQHPLGPIGLWVADGNANDRFISLTEGVVPVEESGPELPLGRARVESRTAGELQLAGELGDGRSWRTRVTL